MTERSLDWAAERRRRWSASRLLAALALHALVLAGLLLAIDRVTLQRRGDDRSTTLVDVVLNPAPPPPAVHPLPLPLAHKPPAAPPRSNANASASASPAPARTPERPREDAAHTITLPAPAPSPSPTVAAAAPPASSPHPDLSFLDNAATRQAIRAVARGDTLSSHGNALTHEEPGSELLAADGTHVGMKRNLPPPPPAVALAQGIDAAHKGDCMKGDYAGGGMGLLSAPFLLANEMLGKCAHKL